MAELGLDSQAVGYDVEGEGIPLVFIHQVGTDRRLWLHQRSAFHRRYKLITIDVMGHGEVPWPAQDFTLERAACHVQALLERLRIAPAFIIGVSLGSAVAMRLALNNPLAVHGLVLVSPWSHITEHTKGLVKLFFRLADRGEMAPHTDLFLRYLLSMTYAERHATEVERLRSLAIEQDARAVAFSWAACLAADLTDQLGRIRAPCLLIAGLSDLFTPPYLARSLAEGLAEVELEIWEDTGHFPFFEDPSRFNRRLEAFIRRCLGRARSE